MTDPFSGAVAAAEAAQTAANTLESQLSAANAEVTSLQAQVASLQAQLAAQSTPATAWGVNASAASEHDIALSVLGNATIDVWRYYHQPNEALTYPTEYALTAGQGLIFSGKVLPQDITVAMLVSLFRSVPSSVPFFYCVWHEPEQEIDAGAFTTAQLAAAWAVARQAHQQVGSPANIKLTPILMGWDWSSTSGRNPEDYLPDPANFDVLGVDTYALGTIGVGTAAQIPTMFDSQIATATGHGKPWLVAETGVGQKVTGAARNAALTSLAQTIKNKGALTGCYFWGGSDTNQWALSTSDGSAAAWLAGQ